MHGFVLFLSTSLNTLSANHGTVKSLLPTIPFDIVAYASPRLEDYLSRNSCLQKTSRCKVTKLKSKFNFMLG